MRNVLIVLGILFSQYSAAQDGGLDSLNRYAETLSETAFVDWADEQFSKIAALQTPAALPLYQRAYSLAKAQGTPGQEGRMARYLGILHYYDGDYEKALRLYQNSLSVFRAAKDPQGEGRTLNELAILTGKQKEFDKALGYLRLAYRRCAQARDSVGMSTAMDNRGIMFMRLDSLDSAAHYFRKVLELRKQIGDSVGLGYVYNNLGWVAASQGNIEQAQYFVNQSTAIRKQLGDMRGVIINIVNTGENHVQAGNPSAALRRFQRALYLLDSTQISYPDLRAYLYGQLASMQAQLERYRPAYQNLLQQKALQDSLLNAEKLRQLSELEVRYETARKDEEIQRKRADLNKTRLQNTQLITLLIILVLLAGILYVLFRARQRKRIQTAVLKEKERGIQAVLEATEAERKRISRDLHDGVGQQIGGLKLAMETLKNASDLQSEYLNEQLGGMGSILQQAADQVRSISHQMMPRALQEQGLEVAIRDLLDATFKYSPIHYDFSVFGIDKKRFDETIELTTYRVLQELLNNVIKHAEARHVDIQLRCLKERLILSVEDDGKGLDSKAKSGKGHGMRNIETRVDAVGGKVSFESEGKGTRATMVIPL